MKYLPLIWAGLWRKPTRTIFTLLSIVVAFLLFGMLQGVNSAFSSAAQRANIDRLYVVSRLSMIEPLPVSYMTRIETVPGVKEVAHGVWFGGYHEEPRNYVFSFAVNAARVFRHLHGTAAAEGPAEGAGRDAQWRGDRRGPGRRVRLEDRRHGSRADGHLDQGRRHVGLGLQDRRHLRPRRRHQQGQLAVLQLRVLRRGARLLEGHRVVVHRAH